MTTPGTPRPLPVGRHALGSWPQYEQAQAVVDHLSDHGFPVETVTIVGADLRLVEQVTGRLTTGKAALAGAASMSWFGLLLGLFVGLFAESGTALLGLALYGLLFGAAFGAALGFAAHRATGGRRDFSSTKGLAAARYEVLVEQSGADEAERLLAQYRAGT
ncbi:MAG TPA: general stress protein [Mycobacteriales bacterium]|nr:general stress protein [Mycobacteriales bacterium]